MEQLNILRHAVTTLEELEIPYFVVGSFASIAYGETRFTQDIDIVLELKYSHIKAFVASFPPPDFFISESAVIDAIKTDFQFNVLHPSTGNKIDFIMNGKSELEKLKMNRRSPSGESVISLAAS